MQKNIQMKAVIIMKMIYIILITEIIIILIGNTGILKREQILREPQALKHGFFTWGENLNSGDVYFVPPVVDFCDLVIFEDFEYVSDLETYGEYLIDNLFVPVRFYYRLIENTDTNGDGKIDGEDNVLTELTAGKGINDYFYTTTARKYYKNDDGWFWGKSIPIDLYNAIERVKFDHEKELKEAEEAANEEEGEENSEVEETEYENKNSGDLSEAEENKAASGILEILKTGYKMNTEDFTKYVPIVLKVTDHWFEDLYYNVIDDGSTDGTTAPCYKYDDSEEVETRYAYAQNNTDDPAVQAAAEANIMYIEEHAPGKITQEHKPKAKNTGVYLQTLLDKEYYIYDGYGRSEEKKKIDFKNISVDAIAMLEQIQGEDAQQIIRMFKIFMAKQGVEFEATAATKYKKEICSKVLSEDDWNCEDNLLVEDDSSYVLRADIPPTQYGFPISTGDKPIYVLAPVNGEITYRSDDNICIQINDTTKHIIDDTNTPKSVKDWTILISGIRVRRCKRGRYCKCRR